MSDRRRGGDDTAVPEGVRGAVPPHDLAAEAVVLSDVLLRPGKNLGVVRSILKVEHFFSPRHALVWAAICWCDDGRIPIDLATVAARLHDQKKLEAVGGAAYLAELCDATPAVANVKAHAMIVFGKHRRRVLINAANMALEGGYHGTDEEAGEAFDTLAVKLAEKPHDGSESTSMMLDEALAQVVASTVAMSKRVATGTVAGVSTGFAELDRLTGGMCARQLTFVGAPTGGGKSAIAGDFVLSTCAQGVDEVCTDAAGAPVLTADGTPATRAVPYGAAIFTMEMTCPEWAQRLASNSGGVNYQTLTNGEAQPHHLAAFMQACDQIRDLPIWLEGRLDLTPRLIRAGIREARKAIAARGAKLKLVVIDTVQLVGADDAREGEKENFQLDRVGRELRKMSLDPEFADLCWIVLSQLNTEGELYGTRGFEKHAVNVWIVNVDKKGRASDILVPEGVHVAKVNVRKNRNGPSPRSVPLWFHEKTTRFSESSSIDAGRLGLRAVEQLHHLTTAIANGGDALAAFERAQLEARFEDEEGRPSW